MRRTLVCYGIPVLVGASGLIPYPWRRSGVIRGMVTVVMPEEVSQLDSAFWCCVYKWCSPIQLGVLHRISCCLLLIPRQITPKRGRSNISMSRYRRGLDTNPAAARPVLFWDLKASRPR
jgi:hypothetical protein